MCQRSKSPAYRIFSASGCKYSARVKWARGSRYFLADPGFLPARKWLKNGLLLFVIGMIAAFSILQPAGDACWNESYTTRISGGKTSVIICKRDENGHMIRTVIAQ